MKSIFVAMLTCLSALLVDCGDSEHTFNGKKVDVAEWREEIRLHDGRTIVVRRKERAYSGGFPNATRGRDIDSELSVEEFGVDWKHEQTSTSLRYPMAFEVFGGEKYIVLYAGDRLFCEGKASNEYLAQVMRWTDGRWVEVPLSAFPLDQAILNLSTNYWGSTPDKDAKGLVRWGEKVPEREMGASVKDYFEKFHRSCEMVQKS